LTHYNVLNYCGCGRLPGEDPFNITESLDLMQEARLQGDSDAGIIPLSFGGDHLKSR